MTAIRALFCFLLLGLSNMALAAPSLDDFLRRDIFESMKISPSGEYIAATVPLDGRNVLVVMNRAQMQRTAISTMPENSYVEDFWWANDSRVLFTVSQKRGQLERPQPTGEIFGINADGSDKAGRILVGQRAEKGNLSGTHIKQDDQRVYAELIDLLPSDPDEVLIATWRGTSFADVERMNIHDGRRKRVMRAPVASASFAADPNGEVRIAWGSDSDNWSYTYYRDPDGDWVLINDQSKTGQRVTPAGFNADGSLVYLHVTQKEGPSAIFAFNPSDRSQTRVLGDDTVDPGLYLYSPVDRSLYGVVFMDGLPRVAYLDAEHPFARAHASLAASFPGQLVLPSSFSRDGNLGLFVVVADRNPGDFFLFDRVNLKAELIASRAEWLDPETLAETRPISLKARDGLILHGFLTLPHGSDGKGLPMIVNPHGGPFGVADHWGFEMERQLLASHGYAVLQINFRGSGNYGAAFEAAGYRQWGGAMQDDLTDATRWAIEQGIADAKRICIYGGSYGGYAALMGAAREPDLYRCAAGNVGVYDMALMYRSGDVARERWGRNYLEDTLGQDELAAISPNRLADRITAPVFLAAGAEDERAPPKHTELMRDALKKAGRKVEATIYKNEGHGYFATEVRKDYYTRLLAFFDRHLSKAAD